MVPPFSEEIRHDMYFTVCVIILQPVIIRFNGSEHPSWTIISPILLHAEFFLIKQCEVSELLDKKATSFTNSL